MGYSWVIHPLLRGVTTPEGRQAPAVVHAVGTFFFFGARFSSFHTQAFILNFFFILAVSMRECF